VSVFDVRWATAADADVIARHRAEMFSDMGHLPQPLYPDLVARTVTYLREAIPRAEYIGWLASSNDTPDVVIAGTGVQLRRILPHPMTRVGKNRVAHGNQAIVLNVFVEKPWRRQGIAALLMRHVLEWASSADIDTLVLHASDDGRVLYERLGFVQTNEMRYGRPLR
jgi:GNAT superfamily N-acetyltransferase